VPAPNWAGRLVEEDERPDHLALRRGKRPANLETADVARLRPGFDVRPHPHIGLATVTYLFRGEFQHRDSLGSNQIILPGAVNWMVAGRGVTYSERTSAATRKAPHSLFGIQTWVALPEAQEDAQPSFEHHGKESLPLIESDGVSVRLILK
jgi:redox-sensitive bicupin YhaK (pirin superfamily)